MKIVNESTILIRKGTTVLSDSDSLVELLGDVVVDAVQTADFSWTYCIGEGKRGTAYTVSNGLVSVLR
jgi:hypothetical protein